MSTTFEQDDAALGERAGGSPLASLLSPRSIAVIGASHTPGKVGYIVLDNLIKSGFRGPIIPVNPKSTEILGLPCVARLQGADVCPDLAVIVVPSAGVLAVADDAIAAGVGALAVITSGFRESGAEGCALEKELGERCAAAGVHLLGPNCLGVINTSIHMNASFAPQTPTAGGISVVSQSGALCAAILDLAKTRGLGLAKVISIGNKTNLAEADFLRVLAEDPQTKVIACYLESITDGDAFIRAAEATAAIKPVVVLKAGVTGAGARAASSHTGSLAGGAQVYAAAFRRAGVIPAYNFEALFDITTALAMQPLPKGNRVAIITNAGGPGILAADASEQLGLTVAPLGAEIADRLRPQLPPYANVGNPIDVLGDATPQRYVVAINAALDDDDVDAIITILTPQAMTRPAETAEAIIRSYRGNKPILAAFMGAHDVADARRAFVAADVPDYATPDRAAVALKAMCDYAAWRVRPPRVVTRIPVNLARVNEIITGYGNAGLTQAREADAKSILREYGFDTMAGGAAESAAEACALAESIGYPVVMKIMSPDIVHKSDVGGVKLSLWSRQEVLDAYDLMMLRIARRMPEARLSGVQIERMAPAGREVILGMTRDPQFGPVLMFGLGGVFVEVMKDVAFYLAPISAADAREMLSSTRSFALLEGARGQAPIDLDAIVLGLQRISQLAVECDAISELDINPFIVGVPGTAAVVADARMTLQFH